MGDVDQWPDFAEYDPQNPCPAIHPDAKEWELADIRMNGELRCGRPIGHDGDHVILVPDPCRECGAMAMHRDDCPMIDAADGSAEYEWYSWAGTP